MTILQKPDALSLSGNIKEFRIGTTDTISFVLYQEEEEIVSRSYSPGADGIVIINIQDIVHARLSFLFKNTALVYEQTSLVSTFKAIISGTQVTFQAIRAGVDMLADSATNFLTQNFLTWQPNLKPVTYYSPEFLTYYATLTCIAKLRAYFTNQAGSVISQSTISLAEFQTGRAYTIPLQYASVAEKLGNKMPAYYDVWVENQSGKRLTYIQRYYASDLKAETESWILFENSLGGIDTFRAYGSTAFTGEHTHNVAEIDEISLEYRIDTTRKFQKDTGYLNAKERTWLLDFFPSLKKYIYVSSFFRSIVVVESNVTYTDKELPSNYTFTYKYADAKPLLNLPRTDVPTVALDITVPEVGSFTVPPRLVEFPRLPLSEGVLFPVQEPYSEIWGTTTTGSLLSYIIDQLSSNYGGGGGIGHQHANIDLLNLLSYVAGYLMIAGKKANVGYADEALSFLDDIARKLILFEKGLKSDNIISTNYLPGLLGQGACLKVDPITGKSLLEVDSAHFREELVVPKITFNCIDVISGDKANTFAFGTIRSVDTANRTIELDLLEGQLGTSKVNDICRGVFHNLSGGNNTSDSADANGFLNYAGFATAYFTPSEILLNEPGAMKLKYTLQPGTTVHPTAGMNFYAYGNFTDKDRQAMTYETRYYTRRLKNVDTWVIDPTRNISMQDGLLEGLTIGGFVMHGHGTFQENTYLTGVNIQFTPSQIEELQGKSAYSASLSSYERVVRLDSQGNLTSLYEELNVISGDKNVISGNENVVTSVYNLSTRIQAFKGETELLFSDAVDKDRYVVVVSATGCRASVSAGILTITEVTNYEECYVDLKINCEGNAVFDKRFSVVVVRNGADGEGSITADIDNEMQSVASDSEGNVTAGLPLTTVFSMYYGSTKLTLDSLARTSVSGVTVTTDKDTGVITVTAITKDVSDTVRIPITGKASYNGLQYERTLYLSVNKVKPGANGENAVIYSLQPSVNVIKKNSAGNSDIANISCRILKTDGALTVVSSRPSGYSLDYIIDSGTPKSYTPGSSIAISGITKDITFRLYAENSSGITMVDQETIPVVQDGSDGTDGHSPYISEHGTWMVWDDDQGKYVDSGDSAKGDDGHSPKIENGTWWVWDADQGKYIDTGIKAKGEDGLNGKNGKYTELRYKYSNGKPDKPSGISPEGWSLDPDVKEPDLTHSGDFYLSDLYYTTGTSTVWNKTYLQRISFVAAEKGQSFKLQVNCYTSRSLRYAVVMKLDTPYTSSYNSEDTLWIGGGYQYTSIEVIAPSAGSHYIELAYAAASSSYAEGQMNYRIIPQKVCYLSSAVIDPNTDSLPVWSDPVVFPTDFPGEEQIYLLSASEMTVEMPRSDSFADDYIGDAYGYNASQMYTKGDVVKYNGVYKVLIAASASGISPDNTQYWQDTKWWTDNPSGVSEAYPYEYTCVRRFNVSNGIWGSYTNYRLFMNLAKDGQSAYQLVASVSQIGRTSTGSYEPETFTVSHKDAEGNAVDAYIGVYGSQDGGAWTKIGSITKVSTVSVNVAQYPYKYFVIRTYEASSSSFDNYLLSTSVSVLSDGEKGDTGATGAMPVYCGFFSAGTEYTYTNTTRDIVNYEIDGGVFTFQVKRHGSAITVPPTSSTGDANWEPAGKFKFVAMDTALIDGANIAGFMYKNLLMKSRLGLLRGAETDIKDVGESDMQWFKPYLQLDGNAGYIDAMANVRVAYQIIDAGTDLKKNLSWMVLNAAGYNRINNLGNPDTGLGLQIYMHELGSQVFIGNFYSYALYVFLNVQLSDDATYADSITTVKIKIPAGKMFRGVVIPNALTYRNGGVTVIEQDGTEVRYPFSLCIYPYSELSYIGVTGNYNNIPYYEVVH